jgi:quercetin dioxygenase-like cupin family protein
MAVSPKAGVLAGKADLPAAEEDRSGAVWRLDPVARQLDANLVRLPPGTRGAAHVEPDLDVLVCVVDGSGELAIGGERQSLEPGCVAWLPHGMERAVSAGPAGLAYVTAHRRRPGMTIGNASAVRRPAPAAEPACMLNRICPECDHPAEDTGARYCSRCGARLAAA